jgi:hypothetical protein
MTDADEKEPKDDSSGDDDPSAEEGSAGTSDPSKRFRENPPDEDEQKEIEETREERLDPENRPEGSEVDNTPRTFDDEEWKFEDDEGGDGGIVDPTEKAADRGHGPDNDGDESGSSDTSDTGSKDQDSSDQSTKDSDEESTKESDKEEESA